MDINIIIKRLREAKGFTHETMAERLHMARSTYTKLESGRTELNYKTLVNISKALNVPLNKIIPDDKDTDPKSISEDLAMMLFDTDHHLSEKYFEMIPYNELKPEHKLLLRQKGFDSREAYEDTPLGGRIYKFGPRDLRRFMFENCGQDIFFKRGLILDDYWKTQWEIYLKDKEKINIEFDENGSLNINDRNDIEIDTRDYFVVFLAELKMPDNSERSIQFAPRDFSDDFSFSDNDFFSSATEILEFIITKTGAISGDILCWTQEGYDPISEIIKQSDL